MNKEEFCYYRRKLGKTQQELANILGMSLKTIHSYEQGCRVIPAHIARYLYFLIVNQRHEGKLSIPCWERKLCPEKENCPAWEFNCGHLCWFISGTRCNSCEGEEKKGKLDACKACAIFSNLLDER
ncbi:MAG: helix-turn-helix domain-containing protein [Desulfobulbaceae bacterium]|jgi:DNA-binding XRE family transcriptional regulator|nr:helix-turn-helix domain-containing protein [Desulfobulbaceae bacterium]